MLGAIAALAAGPWPALPVWSLAVRAPVAAAALIVAWRRLGKLHWLAVGLATVALALDAAVPARVTARMLAERATARIAEVQRRLAALADRDDLRRTLAATGSEAAPEAPFEQLEAALRALPAGVDALVLADERGESVAWAGPRAKVPLRLRLLGERVVTAEPGLQEAWIWWREPILDGGRTVGVLLAGAVLPEKGARRVLGIAAGRAGLAAARWDGGEALRSPIGVRLVGVEVAATGPVAWSQTGGAALISAVALALVAHGTMRLLAIGGIAALLLISAKPGPEWWLPVGLASAALGLYLLQRRIEGEPGAGLALRRVLWLGRAAAAGGAAWLLPGLLIAFDLQAIPERLLGPAPWQVALVVAWAALLWRAGAKAGRPHWWLQAPAWLPLLAGAWLAKPWLLGVGAACVALFGLPAGSAAACAFAAALLVVGADGPARRAVLVARTESTLLRLANQEVPAQALLAAIPETGLADLVQLSPPEQVIVLGRVAGWLAFDRELPGGSLVLMNRIGEHVAVWGRVLGGWGLPPRELASRELANGWRLAVLTPERPHDLLEALAAAGVGGPTAAFDRSGAPVSRGATFRPLAPDRVGRALGRGTSWGRVAVGERELPAYLRAYRGWVAAVPWIRPPLAEAGLAAAALALWAAAPLALWRGRRRLRELAGQRRTISGRMRALSAAATLLPLLLLAQLLPAQWVRQQQRARLELGRALSLPLTSAGLESQLPSLVRDLGATVVVYESGRLAWCSRPDLVAAGVVPSLPPVEAFVRAVRGWREPLVTGDGGVSVFAPAQSVPVPLVVAISGLQVGALALASSPAEWFVVTGLWAAALSLAVAARMGRRVTSPLRRLVHATRRLERGEPVAALRVHGDEEVVALSRAFEAMAGTVQRREIELRRERDLLDGVLRTLSAAVIVLSPDGGTELANAAARRLLGGGDHRTALRGRFGAAIDEMLARASGGETVAETVRPPAAPEAVWQITVMPLAERSGSILVVMEDLSEVARAERLASLAELARIAAHEVKNPLMPIRLWAEELQAALADGGGRLGEIAASAAGQILERVDHLREVAQSFSNLVALEHWERQPVLLGPLAREVVEEYAVLGKRSVAVRYTGGDSGCVAADPNWVRRAIRHLLDNSVRAIGPKGGEVVVALEEGHGKVVLTVRDSGGGVPDSHLGRLFEPYFSTTSEGSGLGLAVVRRVMDRAGGCAEAHNVAGGLEVRLVFPAHSGGGAGSATL